MPGSSIILQEDFAREKFMARDWNSADGIHITKEKDSKALNQFWSVHCLI